MQEQIKSLDPSARSFVANGRKYIVNEQLTLDGFQKLEELRIEVETGNSAKDMLNLNQRAYSAMNAGKNADAAVHLYNSINISERIIEGRSPAWLLSLALFARPEGADVTTWSEADAETWIQDWKEEGYSARDLFFCLVKLRTEYDNSFSPVIQGTSSEPNENEKTPSEASR